MMDVSILTELGIEWREGNFLHNRRLQFDEVNGFSLTQGVISGNRFRVRHAAKTKTNEPSATVTSVLPEVSYELPVGKGKDLVKRWKHLWAALTHDQFIRSLGREKDTRLTHIYHLSLSLSSPSLLFLSPSYLTLLLILLHHLLLFLLAMLMCYS
jgi:hypothetical protein